jgi:hypothetical protein
VQHEPRGFLSHAKIAGKLARANAVLRNQPRCGQPFFQSKGTILEDRSDFDGELLTAVFAVPNPARQNKVANVFRAAMRAVDAARPTHRNHKVVAVFHVAKIANRACKCLRNVIEVCRFHAVNLHLVNNVSSI